MPLVAKRKVRQTWREAVKARAQQRAGSCLPAFDALLREGIGEAEAAYRVLDGENLLWLVDEPGTSTPTRSEPGEVPGV